MKQIMNKIAVGILSSMPLLLPMHCYAASGATQDITFTGAVGTYIDNMDKGVVPTGSGAGTTMKGLSNQAIGISANFYGIVRTVVLILVLIFCIVSLVKLAFSGSGKSSKDGKDGIRRGMIALFAIAATSSFVVLLYTLASSW